MMNGLNNVASTLRHKHISYMGRVMDAGGRVTHGGVGGKNFSATFGGRKISPRGPAPGKGGGRKFFYPGGSLLVKIGQNFFTWGVIW